MDILEYSHHLVESNISTLMLLDFLACPTPGIKRTKGPRSQGQKRPGITKIKDLLSKEEAVQFLHSIVNCILKQQVEPFCSN